MRIASQAIALAAAAWVARAECVDRVAEARGHLARGQWTEAERALNACLAAEANHSDAEYWLVHVLFQTNRYADALARVSPWLARNPENAQARKVEGLSLFMLGRSGEARRSLERAVRLAPADAEARYYFGRVLFTLQDMPGALREFEKSVEIDPVSVRAYNHLGQTLEALARFDDAGAAYRKAIAIEKTQRTRSEWPYFNLGVLELKNGRPTDAAPMLEAAIERAPKMWEARVQLAVARAAEARLDDAHRELAHVLANAPGLADAHYQMGRLLTKMGRPAEARRHLARFAELRSQPPPRND